MNYGVDVAATRADDLDKLILKKLENDNKPTVLDIGAGAGGQARRMIEKGAVVTALDIFDYSSFYKIEEKQSLFFIHADIKTFLEACTDSYDYCVLQRTLHYLKHDKALEVLDKLKQKVGSQLYISVSGLESDIAKHYEAKNQPIATRFANLGKLGVEKFQIDQPICLYTQSEFINILKQTDWEIERVWTSAFGNHKAVCTPKI